MRPTSYGGLSGLILAKMVFYVVTILQCHLIDHKMTGFDHLETISNQLPSEAGFSWMSQQCYEKYL